jgi:hypothetical protein
MFKGLIAAAALTLSALGASSAQATVLSFDVNDGGFVKKVLGTFSYDYEFTIPTGGSLSASLTSSTNLIHFTSITLNGVALTKDTGPNNYSLATAIAGLTGTQIFHIAGTSSGKSTFSTTVDFISAVPEPAAWGMMVIGFGALGATMRQRKTANMVVNA